MQIPSAMFIEAAADLINEMNPRAVRECLHELLTADIEAPTPPGQTPYERGYLLGLQTMLGIVSGGRKVE